MTTITADQLAAAASILLSLVLSYFPPVRQRFEPLASDSKQLINGVLVIVVGAGAFALSCLNWFGLAIACNQQGIEGLVQAVVVALIANSGIYQSTKYVGTLRGKVANAARSATLAQVNPKKIG